MDSIHCYNSNPPDIDFNKNTLLGYTFLTTTAKSYYYSRFFQNDSLMDYKLVIDIMIPPGPDDAYTARQWLLVPKLDSYYKVILDTIMHY